MEISAQKTRTVLIVLQHEEAPTEATAQKTRKVLIVPQHEEAPREATAQKTRTVLFVLQQDKGIPDNRGTSDPIALYICTTDTRQGHPGQSGDVGPFSTIYLYYRHRTRASRTIGGRRSL